ncbi:ABC-type transport auxiliary lipoprotein family protein [Allorhizobium terrae]|uniref:ABC transporter n=1 Tax=Allorhizobium terrae TaxID=1848972 RepID=A0A4S4A2J0_9HYPH|nr:ABC-type transport auxiliary lipoprotein family protein [Allorhizobium terrae]THF52599.1 ABC transporter [Allorhizobium terrae]TWD57603.1 cholesterol transport system auxiliary component [Agrobacterium vitis]
MSYSKVFQRPFAALRTACAVSLMGVMLAGCGAGTNNDTYDLASVRITPPAKAAAAKRQLLIANPTALKMLDSDMVVVRVSGTEVQYLAKSQWGDKLPLMVQSKLVEAFDSTGKLAGVGKPGQGLAIDYQLISDIRTFEIDTDGGRRANVSISVKLLNDRNGTVVSQKVFSATVPVRGDVNQAMINALSQAFGKVTSDIVTWTLATI